MQQDVTRRRDTHGIANERHTSVDVKVGFERLAHCFGGFGVEEHAGFDGTDVDVVKDGLDLCTIQSYAENELRRDARLLNDELWGCAVDCLDAGGVLGSHRRDDAGTVALMCCKRF